MISRRFDNLTLRAFCAVQARVACMATAASCVFAAAFPQQAHAAYSIQKIFTGIKKEVLFPLIRGCAAIICSLAVIALLFEVIKVFTADNNERGKHIRNACILGIVAFAVGSSPSLLNWIASLVGVTQSAKVTS